MGSTPCDYCSDPAVVEVKGRGLCGHHAHQFGGGGDNEKRASVMPTSLKTAGEDLAHLHYR